MSQISDVLHVLRQEARRMWQRRWHGIAAAWLIAVVGAVGVSVYKDRFQASAKVFVDTQTVLKPLMAGLAFQPDIDQQVKMLARTLISTPNVEQLLRMPSIGLEQPSPEQLTRRVDELKNQIRFEHSGQGVFSLTFRDTDPQRAQRLVDGMLNLFMSAGTSAKQRDSAEASRFIDEQIKNYEGKLTEAENRLKEFKLRNFGDAGVSTQDYFARIAALSEVVNKLKLDLGAAEQSRDALRRELSNEDPQLPPESMPAVVAPPVPNELEQRIEAQKRTLDDLLRRYTDEHPDVVAVRRTVAQLENQRRLEAAAKASGAGRSRGNAATNPVFQQLRVALASAEANVASLRSQLANQQGRLDQARAQASRVPQIEADLAQLNRDYDVMRKNYEQLVTRREAASLGVKIDQSSSLAEFRLIEPPQVSFVPVFPSRKILSLLVLPAALLGGLVVLFLSAQLSSTVEDERTLRQLVRRPVLGTMSLVVNQARQMQLRRQTLAFAGAVGLLVFFNLGWVAWVMTMGRA